MQASERLFFKPISRSLAVAVAAASMTIAPSIPRASEPTSAELVAARELFAKGVEQEEAHQWADALATFRRVAAVKLTAAVHFHLGLCLENTGRLVDALNEFNRANEGAGTVDPDAALIVEKSKKHVAELETRTPRISVTLPTDVEEIAVTLDDAPIARTLLGSAIPVDPGAHVLRATAPRHLAFERSFEAKESTTTPIEVQLAIDPNAPPPPSSDASRGSSTGAWPWVVGALGVASLGGAATMFVLRSKALSDLESVCPSHSDCPPEKQGVYETGRRDALVGDILLGVGIAAVATSVVLFTIGGAKKEEPHTSVVVSPFGAGFVGSF